MEEILKQILGELQKVNNRLDRLEKGQERLQTGQEKLQTEQERLQTGQEKLQIGQDRLQTGQDQLKDNLINGLGPYFEQIEKHIDAKTDELKDTLEDQQRVIDILASRSIKHESEIKDFKRLIKNQ